MESGERARRRAVPERERRGKTVGEEGGDKVAPPVSGKERGREEGGRLGLGPGREGEARGRVGRKGRKEKRGKGRRFLPFYFSNKFSK